MIKVLQKADRILHVLSERPGIAFGDLVETLGIHKATLSNILSTLTELGYVERDREGGRRIGPVVRDLAAREKRRAALPRLAEECARALAEELRETVTVGQLLSGDRYNLAKATVERTVTVNARVELRPTPYETATGRALLAFCSSAQLEEALDKHGLPGGRWRGVTSRRALLRALKRIRSEGCAELSVGDARTFAVPVLDSGGGIVAAVGTSIPSYRLADGSAGRVREALRAAAARMERGLSLAAEEGVEE